MTRLTLMAACIVVLGFVAPGSATILTFEIDGKADNSTINADYGDNVAQTQVGNYHYLEGNGWTPDIAVAYATAQKNDLSDVNLTGIVRWWSDGYGDLDYVIWNFTDTQLGLIIFTPQEGWMVRLNSFDIAAWGGDGDIGGLDFYVTDDQYNILWSETDVTAPDTGRLTFSPNITHDGVLHFYFDGAGSYVGTSNINFDQVLIPEPASLMLLAAGTALMLARRRHAVR